ncbi:MAG: AIR synthase related protein, partial [Terracidiphilus sp.]
LLVAAQGREAEVLAIFDRWGLEAVRVGEVTADGMLRVTHHGAVVAEIPNAALTDAAPRYERPQRRPPPSLPHDAPAGLRRRPRNWGWDLMALLQAPNVCSKRWLWRQYDTMVRTNTLQGPGGDAGVIRIETAPGQPPAPWALAMALDGNGRYCALDPRSGARLAVAEAARKVACTGATPVAATNCLNFGNPEKPEIMAQLSAAIDGIADACTALGTPITGGNVSLYNETRGVGIYPTPVLGIVGILDDVTLAVPAHFQRAGDDIVLLWPIPEGETPDPDLPVPLNPPPISQYPMPIFESQPYDPRPDASALAASAALAAFGSSEYAKVILGGIWGHPPQLDLAAEARLHHLLEELADRRLIHSARDLSDGGIAVALAQAAFANGVGAVFEQDQSLLAHPCFGLFAEPSSTIVVSAAHERLSAIDKAARDYGFFCARIGATGGSRLEISVDRQLFISASIAELHTIWAEALEANLHSEVSA